MKTYFEEKCVCVYARARALVAAFTSTIVSIQKMENHLQMMVDRYYVMLAGSHI